MIKLKIKDLTYLYHANYFLFYRVYTLLMIISFHAIFSRLHMGHSRCPYEKRMSHKKLSEC